MRGAQCERVEIWKILVQVVFVPAGVGVHATLLQKFLQNVMAINETTTDWPHATTAPSRPRRVWILTCIATGGARGGSDVP